jgi:hypothetical protein
VYQSKGEIMRIVTPTWANLELVAAIDISNRLLQGEGGFFDRVREIPTFDLSGHVDSCLPVSGAEVAQRLAQNVEVAVRKYRPKWIGSRAMADTQFTSEGMPVIRFNARKLHRTTEDFVATLIHECVHGVDTLPKEMYFGHGNNSPKGKENTAPYRIERIAQELVPAIVRAMAETAPA